MLSNILVSRGIQEKTHLSRYRKINGAVINEKGLYLGNLWYKYLRTIKIRHQLCRRAGFRFCQSHKNPNIKLSPSTQ